MLVVVAVLSYFQQKSLLIISTRRETRRDFVWLVLTLPPLPGVTSRRRAHQARAGHVALRGGKSGLRNKPIFPQPLCLSLKLLLSEEPEAHASGACLLPQVEHACARHNRCNTQLTGAPARTVQTFGHPLPSTTTFPNPIRKALRRRSPLPIKPKASSPEQKVLFNPDDKRPMNEGSRVHSLALLLVYTKKTSSWVQPTKHSQLNPSGLVVTRTTK